MENLNKLSTALLTSAVLGISSTSGAFASGVPGALGDAINQAPPVKNPHNVKIVTLNPAKIPDECKNLQVPEIFACIKAVKKAKGIIVKNKKSTVTTSKPVTSKVDCQNLASDVLVLDGKEYKVPEVVLNSCLGELGDTPANRGTQKDRIESVLVGKYGSSYKTTHDFVVSIGSSTGGNVIGGSTLVDRISKILKSRNVDTFRISSVDYSSLSDTSAAPAPSIGTRVDTSASKPAATSVTKPVTPKTPASEPVELKKGVVSQNTQLSTVYTYAKTLISAPDNSGTYACKYINNGQSVSVAYDFPSIQKAVSFPISEYTGVIPLPSKDDQSTISLGDYLNDKKSSDSFCFSNEVVNDRFTIVYADGKPLIVDGKGDLSYSSVGDGTTFSDLEGRLNMGDVTLSGLNAGNYNVFNSDDGLIGTLRVSARKSGNFDYSFNITGQVPKNTVDFTDSYIIKIGPAMPKKEIVSERVY